MRMFDDAVDWKKTGDRTLTFNYPHKGKRQEQSLVKCPEMLWMQLERISLLNETSWPLNFAEGNNSQSQTGYSTRQYISAFACLVRCRIHGVALDDTENIAFVRLNIGIYPTSPGKVQETVDSLRSLSKGEVPEGQVLNSELKSELGRLVYHWNSDEVYTWPELYAVLYLDHEAFNALAENIKAGGIRSAMVQVSADLYGLTWSGGLGADADYVILLEDNGSIKQGIARALLVEMTLEWSPVLEMKTGGFRDDRGMVEAPAKVTTPDSIPQPKRDINNDKQEAEPSSWLSFLGRSRSRRT